MRALATHELRRAGFTAAAAYQKTDRAAMAVEADLRQARGTDAEEGQWERLGVAYRARDLQELRLAELEKLQCRLQTR